MKLNPQRFGQAEVLAATGRNESELAIIRNVLPEYEEKTERVFEVVRTGDIKAAKAALEANAPVIKTLNQRLAWPRNRKGGRRRKNGGKSTDVRQRAAAHSCAAGRGNRSGYRLKPLDGANFRRPAGQNGGRPKRIAQGDFTKRLAVDSRDEMGRMAWALNRAVASVRETLLEVADASHRVGAASQELAKAIHQISGRRATASASLDETSPAWKN